MSGELIRAGAGATSISKCAICLLLIATLVKTSIQIPFIRQSNEPGSAQECNCRLNSNSIRECSDRPTFDVDHRHAMTGGSSQAGRIDYSCLPDQIPVNERVCYRTSVSFCPEERAIQCSLRRRNNLCEGDSNELRLSQGERTTLYMKSPRYDCVRTNLRNKTKPLNYRNRDFCIYNISMPCEYVHISTIEDHMDLQPKNSDGRCEDYVEFDFGPEYGTERRCGSETYQRTIRASDFIAVFWTDEEKVARGFELAVTCLAEEMAS